MYGHDTFRYSWIGQFAGKIEKMEGEGVATLVDFALRAINTEDDNIRRGLAGIQSRLNVIAGNIAMGNRMNDLGEFQREPVDVDRAVARRQLAFDMLSAVLAEDLLNEIVAEIRRPQRQPENKPAAHKAKM